MKSCLKDCGRKACVNRSAHTGRPDRKKTVFLKEEPSSKRAAVRVFPDYTIDQRDLT